MDGYYAGRAPDMEALHYLRAKIANEAPRYGLSEAQRAEIAAGVERIALGLEPLPSSASSSLGGLTLETLEPPA
jgi:hypothetical protein